MAQKKKPAMPSASALSDSRRGGLGRGLASLIPSGPSKPSLGNGAADIIIGNGENGTRGRKRQESPSPSPSADKTATKSSQDKRHNDETEKGGGKAKKPAQNRVSRSESSVEGHSSDRGTTAGDSARVNDAANDFGASYQELDVANIRTNAKQPRSVFDEEALGELVHSLREFGLMQPIVVRRAPDGETDYELIMGERRLRAAKKAGFTAIPSIIRETDDDAMLRDALLENIHRVQLNPLEEAAAYQQLMEEFGVTQEQLAQRIGRSRPLITNMIRLLQLPVGVQRRVGAGVLSAGHARALLGLKAGAEAQNALADRIVAEGMSVRATEEAVTLLNREGGSPTPTSQRKSQRGELPESVSTWVTQAGDALETKVSVQMGKKKGKIVVEFGGPEDFERIIELMRFTSED